MKKTITAVVVAASAVAAPAALAAIDDAGMRYISASEGFGGSLRVRLLSDTNALDSSVETSLGSTRLYVIGEGDMGNGLTSTYYWEWRVKDNAGALKTDSVHVGLKGVFGAFQAGHIEPVGSAMLPSPDLTNDVGVSGQKLNETGNHQQAMRWISPKINGLQFGVSAGLKNESVILKNTLAKRANSLLESKNPPLSLRLEFVDSMDITTNISTVKFIKPYVTGDDDTIDSFDLAVTYDAPQGIKLGASYESRAAYLHSVSKALEVTVLDPLTVTVSSGAFTRVFRIDNTAEYSLDNDAKGFRLAGSYGQDNWQIAYNYRAYDHALLDFEEPREFLRFLAGHKDTKYTAHSFGGTVDVDKFTFGFGYQLANLKNRAVTFDRNTFSFDAGYSFTSKARIIAAYSKTDTDEFRFADIEANVFQIGSGAVGIPATAVPDESKTYLLYRIDF